MPQPTDGGKTYAFKIRDSVKFHDGSPLTAADVAASWEKIIHPPEGVLSPRESHYMMVDTVEAPDPTTRAAAGRGPTKWPRAVGCGGSCPEAALQERRCRAPRTG
jgi:MarR-like DNA-binding transcriptional regulator SgrR of sgrS sRNA